MFDEKLFKARLVLCGLTIRDIAKMLNVNEATVYRKIRRDGDFSRAEIQTMCKAMKIDDPQSIFFSQRLT